MTRSESSPLLRTALDEADRRERMARIALLGAALVEALLLGIALLVMDFDDRTHLLVFVLSVLGYTTLALGLVVVGARSSAANARLLHAIHLLDERRGS